MLQQMADDITNGPVQVEQYRPPADRPLSASATVSFRRGRVADVKPQGWRSATSVEPDATLIEYMRSVVYPATLGDPMQPLLWVVEKPRQSRRRIAKQGSRDQRQQREETIADASATARS